MVISTVFTPLLSHFAAACAEHNFLGLMPWYHYLPPSSFDNNCNVINFNVLGTGSGFLLILLAVVDDLLRIVGLMAVCYVIMSGINYIMSQGSPEGIAKAQSALIHALMGLAIALISVQFVAFIGNRIGGNPLGSANSVGLDLGALPNPTGANSGAIVPRMLSIVFGITGALAFLFLVVGGFSYVASQGDPQKVGKAKNTVMYSLIGLVVAILAQAIVAFVVSRL